MQNFYWMVLGQVWISKFSAKVCEIYLTYGIGAGDISDLVDHRSDAEEISVFSRKSVKFLL